MPTGYELDWAQPLQAGFQMGLKIQDMRNARRQREEAIAYQTSRLEIERMQEKRLAEENVARAAAKAQMEANIAERQAASAAFTFDVFDAFTAGAEPWQAVAMAVKRNPKASQVENSIANLLPSRTQGQPTTVEERPDGSKIVTGPGRYIPATKKPSQVTDVNDAQDFVFNSSGVPFYRDSKGELQIPPGSDKIREQYLKDQRLLNTSKESLKMEEKKPKGGNLIGFGKPNQVKIDRLKATIEEIESKYRPTSKTEQKAPETTTEQKVEKKGMPTRGAMIDPIGAKLKGAKRVKQLTTGKIYVLIDGEWVEE